MNFEISELVYYQCWTLEDEGNTFVEILFLDSSQTEECPDEIIQLEKVHIALWEEFRPSSDSSVNDSGCLATSSPIETKDVFHTHWKS